MIKVEGQFALNSRLGDLLDFFNIDNLRELTIIEKAGTDLPVIDLVFSSDERGLRRLNENVSLVINLGSDEENMLDSEFILQRPAIAYGGDKTWTINAKGIHVSLINWSSPKVEISKKQSGVERIIEVLNTTNDVVSNIKKSNDSQNWIQYGQPNKHHIDDIWMHVDLPNSFLLLAAGLDSFKVYDMLTHVGNSPKWTFTSENIKYSNEINFDSDYVIEHQGGFFNSIGARGQQQPVYNLDTGESDLLSNDPESLLALTDKLNVNANFEKVHNARKTLSRNVHPNYWKSFIHNYTQIALYSTTRVTLSWTGSYYPIRPLDLVMFKEQSHDKNLIESVEMYSGLYLVSKVSRRLNKNALSTTVQLVRETSTKQISTSVNIRG